MPKTKKKKQVRGGGNRSFSKYTFTNVAYDTTLNGITRQVLIDPTWMNGCVQLCAKKISECGGFVISAAKLVPHQDFRWTRNRGIHWKELEDKIYEKEAMRTETV